MILILRRRVDSNRFQHFVTLVILLAAVLVGIETYPSVVASYGPVLHALNQLVLFVFVAEVVLKMGAEGRRPWRYFGDFQDSIRSISVRVRVLSETASKPMGRGEGAPAGALDSSA